MTSWTLMMDTMKGPDEHGSTDDPMRYASAYHTPVLCNAVTAHLVTDPNGLYVDGTLGGGGHSAALLDRLGPGGRVVGIDQDADALAAARARLADEVGSRFFTVRGNFADLPTLLRPGGFTPVDGLLLDLGVSSFQIDTAERGFSFDADGPLDMRMNAEDGMSAADIVNTWREGELTRLMRKLGEEPRAPKLARQIVKHRPFATTGELADVIRQVVPYRETGKTLARVFQALRIAVNDELHVLERALVAALEVLRPGGRIAVISYHSLEDRRVKRFLRYGNLEGEPVRDFYGNLQTPWHLITRKPIGADETEVQANPRARSARLRIAEKA